MRNGKPVFLDATETYLGLGETAERIQGRQTLIENGDSYLLQNVPPASCDQNTASETRTFRLEGNELKGHVVQIWKGESKENLLTQLNDIKQEKQEKAMKQYLAEGMKDFEITNLQIGNINNYNADVKVSYDVVWKNALSNFDKDYYLEIDNRRYLKDFVVDTEKRKLPYWFSFKNHLLFQTEIAVPAGSKIASLPQPLSISEAGYSFKASYENAAGKIIYKNEITISKTDLQPADFERWNADIKKLSNFYNQQIVFTKN